MVKSGQQADAQPHGMAARTEPQLDSELLFLIFKNPLHLK